MNNYETVIDVVDSTIYLAKKIDFIANKRKWSSHR